MARTTSHILILTYPEWSRATVSKIQRGQRSELNKELKIAESLFNIVTAKFSAKNQPNWHRKVTLTGGEMVGTVDTTTPPFPYLAEGTKKRYAVLSPDYRKRTVPGAIRSGASRGRAIARGKRAVPAGYARRKAIQPGNWHHVIARLRRKPWAIAMQKRLTLDSARLHVRIRSVRIL